MPKHNTSLPDVRSRVMGGDEITKPKQDNNHQQSQVMIHEKENGPVGAATPNKAKAETTLVKSAVPNGIEHPAGAGVNRVQAPNTTVFRSAPQIPFHPLADTIPLMKSEELKALADDIRAQRPAR